MADFGIKATQMGDPSLAAAGFTKQPIANTSGVELLGTIGNMGVKAFEGYELANLEKAQEAVIDEYMTGKERKADIENQTIDVATLKGGIDSIWKQASSVEELDEKASPVEIEYQGRLKKLQLAVDQGVMTPAQFQTKILATTREAVNRSPGLYDKLLDHSKKVLGLSGIDAVLDADMASAKAQQEGLKNLRELADKHDVGYNHFNPDYDKMQSDVLQRQREISASNALTRGIAADTQVKKEDALSFIANQGSNAISGDSFTLKSTAAAMFAGATPQDYPKIKNKLRLDVEARRQAIIAQTNKQGIRNDPAVKTFIEDYDSSMKMQLDAIDSLESGEDAQKVLDHTYAILVGSQKIGMARNYNIGALETLRLFPDSVLNSVMADQKSGNFAAFSKLAQSVFDGAISNKETRAFLQPIGKPGEAPVAVDAAFGTLLKEKDPTKLAELASKVIDFSVDGVNPENFETAENQMKYLDSVFTKMADPKFKDKFAGLDTNALGNAFKLTEKYFQTIGDERDKLFQESLSTGIVGEQRSIAVYADITPDGRVIFHSPDAKTQMNFNSKFAGRINLGIDATANLMGISRKEAITDLLPRYKQIWGIETNIQTGPKAIKGKEAEFMRPDSVSMTLSPTEILQVELDDLQKLEAVEKNPTRRKMINTQIQWTAKELERLGK